jgi:hypothetical protein
MIILFSFILALFLFWTSPSFPLQVTENAPLLIFFTGVATWLTLLLIIVSLKPSIIKNEQFFTPFLGHILRKDHLFHFLNVYIYLFAFLSIVYSFSLFSFLPFNTTLPIWIFFFGLTLEILHFLVKRLCNYATPSLILNGVEKYAIWAIEKDHTEDFLRALVAIGEIGTKGAEQSLSSLAIESLATYQKVFRTVLNELKRKGSQLLENQDAVIKDPAGYSQYYLFDQLEVIFNEALNKRLISVVSSVLTTSGGIAVDSAKYDLSLISYPLIEIGKFTRAAQEKKCMNIGEKGTLTFLVIAKKIFDEIDTTYFNLKEPFFTLINQMEEIAKETFRQDREINISLLMEPFRQLKGLFEQGKAVSHPDTPSILADIARVIGEFDQLALVLKTLPVIPNVDEKKEKEVTP